MIGRTNATTGSEYWYGECAQAASVVDRTVNVGSGFVLKNGVAVRVLMTSVNAISATLNVNGTGKRNVSQTVDGNPLSYAGVWKSNSVVDFVYNEEWDQWVLVDRGVAATGALGLVKLTPSRSALQLTTNGSYVVPRANDVANAFQLLVTNVTNTSQIITLTAANWTDDNTYSLETQYPSDTYNLQISISSTATNEQCEAFEQANIVGNDSTNVLTARNGKPTVDIPVKIQTFVKNWGDM